MVDNSLVQKALGKSCREMHRHVSPAVDIRPRDERVGCGLLARSRPLMRKIDILHGITVTGNPLFFVGPAPVLAEDCL